MKRNTKWLRLTACLTGMALGLQAVSLAAQAPDGSRMDAASAAGESTVAARNVATGKDIAPTTDAAQDPSALAELLPQTDVDKKETVYVFADAAGTARETLVGVWLQNPDGAAALPDVTTLTDLENLKADDLPTPSADGHCRWQADGADVYYQGHSDRALPVTVSVQYLLDGKEIAPDALQGASGHLTIRCQYQNHDAHTVRLEGGSARLYTPYLALDVLLVDNSQFRNITVEGGKLLNDGDRSVLLGLALPGLRQSLGLPDTKMPETITVEADVSDCALPLHYALVAPLPAAGEADDGELSELTDTLQQATEALTGGADQLAEGLATLLASVGQLQSGVDALAAGGSQLSSGAASLQSGLGQLNANSEALNAGARQVFDSLCATAGAQVNSQLAAAGLGGSVSLTPENYPGQLDALLEMLGGVAYEQAKATVSEKVTQAVTAEVTGQVTAAVRGQVTQQVTAEIHNNQMANITAAVTQQVAAQLRQAIAAQSPALTDDEVDALLAQQLAADAVQAQIAAAAAEQAQQLITQTVEAQMAAADVQALIAQNVQTQMAGEAVQALIASNIAEQLASEAVQNQIQSALNADSSYQALLALRAQLDGYNSFYTGLRAYTAGVGQAAAGAGSLVDGAAQLSGGLAQLQGQCPQLTDGVSRLHEGAVALSDGLRELVDQTLDRLSEAAGGDAETLGQRLQALGELAEDAQNFSGLAEDASGSVRYIFKFEQE